MKTNLLAAAAAGLALMAGVASAADWGEQGSWNNGVLFVAGPNGEAGDRAANMIVFGLKDGACSGKIDVGNPEELFVVAGIFKYEYEGKTPEDMSLGSKIVHPAGTKIVNICAVGTDPAILVGVQHPPK